MKTVIEMAREAGLVQESEYFYSPREEEADVHIKDLERFAELVRTDEREACAKVCDELDKADETFYRELSDASVCAATIRARGQT